MGFSTSTCAPAFKKRAHDSGMGAGRRADADDIDLAQKLAPIGDDGNIEMGFDGVARFEAGIGDRCKLNAGNLQIFARMVAAEYARAHNGGPQYARFGKPMNGQKLRPCCTCEFTKNSMPAKGFRRHS